MKKAQIKAFLKKKKGVIIGTGSFLIIGLVLLLVGFSLTGWSFIEWLQTPYALSFFLVLCMGLYGTIMIIIEWKRQTLGGY